MPEPGGGAVTPYEGFYHRTPDLSRFKPFGCVCYAHVPEETRQIPAGFEGAPSTEDPNRVDASAWLDRVPVIRQFRRVLARTGVRGSGR